MAATVVEPYVPAVTPELEISFAPTDSAGKLTEPEIERLVVEALVIIALVMVVVARLVFPLTLKSPVEVALVNVRPPNVLSPVTVR